jgi:hypothetical protein
LRPGRTGQAGITEQQFAGQFTGRIACCEAVKGKII